MSEQIDWSRAPEWVTKHGLSGAFKSPVWFDDKKYTYVDGQQDGKEFFYADACTYAAKDFSQVSGRPTAPSWSGEGLPPVGVVCEVRNAPGGWGKATIKYQGKGIIVWLWDRQDGNTDQIEFASCPDRLEFRPIRTPEQIAADEREAAIKEMTAGYAKNSDTLAGWAAYVYDTLGYRKP